MAFTFECVFLAVLVTSTEALTGCQTPSEGAGLAARADAIVLGSFFGQRYTLAHPTPAQAEPTTGLLTPPFVPHSMIRSESEHINTVWPPRHGGWR